MDQAGVDIRPLRDLTGHATDFCEVHFDGARTDAANLVGDVDGGWQVAMSTAYLERGVSTVGYQLSFGRQLTRIIDEARRRGRTNDPIVRQRLAQAWAEFQILRWSVLRTLSSVRAGNHSPVTNVYKLFWSAYHQRLGELAIDVLGLDGQLVDEHGPSTTCRPCTCTAAPRRLRRLSPDPAEHHRRTLTRTPRRAALRRPGLMLDFPVFDADNHTTRRSTARSPGTSTPRCASAGCSGRRSTASSGSSSADR
jgi:alkylation response protein AidB-like acyl-CoA dehydrogenase